ncbi:S8 family serine peptidase [Falsiroseomonas oryzae]|uniref:S8 family serine peptidase n=1 Tax=Falsiroseomonas oryzae TaxID=2766473 RepID=UPI0022EAAE2B|nr:S8 family serine peptidase [Roseomonas sp. MO-31]
MRQPANSWTHRAFPSDRWGEETEDAWHAGDQGHGTAVVPAAPSDAPAHDLPGPMLAAVEVGPGAGAAPSPVLPMLGEAVFLVSGEAGAAAGGEAGAAEGGATAADALSNDGSYTSGSLWGMYGDRTAIANAFGSQAGEAWQAGFTGSTKVVVGVVDTGINYTHADLYLNIWLNQREIPTAFRASLADTDGDRLITFRDLNATANAGFVSDINRNGYIDAGDLLNDSRWENGLDEDANGRLDDLIGWDFFNGDNDPWDDNGHGTHVAGTIGAVGGNGTGVVGVNWAIQMVALKFSGADGAGSTSRASLALDYFTAQSRVQTGQDFVATNNSWGTTTYSSALQGAITRAAQANILTVASAGNSAADTDVAPRYPAAYTTTNAAGYDAVISVAALNSSGGLAWFSNFGDVSVDLAAPGDGIVSTLSNGGYGAMSGTSMAAPHVTGAVALYAAYNPNASAAEIRSALLASAIPTDSLAGKTVTGGRLDVDALMRLGAPPPTVVVQEPEPVVTEPAPTGTTSPASPSPDPTPTPPPQPAGLSITGTGGADTLTGGAGNDTISGVPADATTAIGRLTIDVLAGGTGNDVFVLGDARGAFYNDGRDLHAGMVDYARIMDFEAGDRIQVSDDFGYVFRTFFRDGFNGVGIFADTNRSGSYENTDEMIGHVVNRTALAQSDLLLV